MKRKVFANIIKCLVRLQDFWCAHLEVLTCSQMVDLYHRIKGRDWNQKTGVFWISALNSNFYRKEKKDEIKATLPLSLSRSFSWFSFIPLSLLSLLQLTQPNLRIAYVCLLKPAPSSPGSLKKKKKKTHPLGSEIASSHKNASLLRQITLILFYNKTLPRLTFQWHLPSWLSHHMYALGCSFVCHKDSLVPQVSLLWQCHLKTKKKKNLVRPKALKQFSTRQ